MAGDGFDVEARDRCGAYTTEISVMGARSERFQTVGCIHTAREIYLPLMNRMRSPRRWVPLLECPTLRAGLAPAELASWLHSAIEPLVDLLPRSSVKSAMIHERSLLKPGLWSHCSSSWQTLLRRRDTRPSPLTRISTTFTLNRYP